MKNSIKALVAMLLVLVAINVASAHYSQDQELSAEISGKVQGIYHMGFLLDNGKFVMAPWWFISGAGITEGDEVRVKGIVEDNTVFPDFIEVNGKTFGNPDSEYPPWMHETYTGYGYCPMM